MNEQPFAHICCLCGRLRIETRARSDGQDPADWHKASHGFCPRCKPRIRAGLQHVPIEMVIQHYRDIADRSEWDEEALAALIELKRLRWELANAEHTAAGRAATVANLQSRVTSLEHELTALKHPTPQEPPA